ncbi:hypothetical protein HDV00_011985 [Rhizophlyctis rosea]|nr:hypothetical protein HDV00_011985 [Rhizophlyctis rosea]
MNTTTEARGPVDPSTPPESPNKTMSALVVAGDAGPRKLYVGNLDKRVTEPMLQNFFEPQGQVLSVKIVEYNIKNRHTTNYGFVEFEDHKHASAAREQLNHKFLLDESVKISWAFRSDQSKPGLSVPQSSALFIGDLSAEVTSEMLSAVFVEFGSLFDARVLTDPDTGQSRGYGFVTFHHKADAEKALKSMNGQELANQPMRVNWARTRPQNQVDMQPFGNKNGMVRFPPKYGHQPLRANTYPPMVQYRPINDRVIYVGNLSPDCQHHHLASLFKPYGTILETRIIEDKGYGFMTMDTHENAARAIAELDGQAINGRRIKCSWGRSRTPPRINYQHQAAYTYPPIYYYGNYHPPAGPGVPMAPIPGAYANGYDTSGSATGDTTPVNESPEAGNDAVDAGALVLQQQQQPITDGLPMTNGWRPPRPRVPPHAAAAAMGNGAGPVPVVPYGYPYYHPAPHAQPVYYQPS